MDPVTAFAAEEAARAISKTTPLEIERVRAVIPYVRSFMLMIRDGKDSEAVAHIHKTAEENGMDWSINLPTGTMLQICLDPVPLARPSIVPVMRALLERGADVDDASGKDSPLYIACGGLGTAAVAQAVVDLLLEFKADPDYSGDLSPMTPLHRATSALHLGVVSSLLKAGADVQRVVPHKTNKLGFMFGGDTDNVPAGLGTLPGMGFDMNLLWTVVNTLKD